MLLEVVYGCVLIYAIRKMFESDGNRGSISSLSIIEPRIGTVVASSAFERTVFFVEGMREVVIARAVEV